MSLRDVRAMLDQRKRFTFFECRVGGCKRVACSSQLFRGNSPGERLARDGVDRLASLLEGLDSIRKAAATGRGDRQQRNGCCNRYS
jgi:hypothetical protein